MKYYLFDGEPGWSGFKIVEFEDRNKMIDCVRELEIKNERLPTVFYGDKLQFEPAEIKLTK